MSTRQINQKTVNQSAVTLDIPFIPLKTGKYTLPSFSVKLPSGQTLTTSPLSFEIVQTPESPFGNETAKMTPQNGSSPSSPFYFTVKLQDDRTTYYTGENIPLDLYL